MHNETDRDLDWLAFRYVSGEMSASELESFEELLGTDQTAREAVAAAVELLSMMAAASPADVTPVPRSPHRQRRVLAALAAAAALVAVSVVLTQRQLTDTDQVQELVSLWAESDEATDDGAETDPPMNGENDDLAVPGWLLAAIESSDDMLEED